LLSRNKDKQLLAYNAYYFAYGGRKRPHKRGEGFIKCGRGERCGFSGKKETPEIVELFHKEINFRKDTVELAEMWKVKERAEN